MPLPLMTGRVAFVFTEENFDVDQIIGVANIKIQDPDHLARIAMGSYMDNFHEQVRAGDFLIGAANFGYGHPHYPPMQVMRRLGVQGVIAESFAPTYFNIETCAGFPQISCPGILKAVAQWDELEVDWEACEVRNLTQRRTIAFTPPSRADQEILMAGGIVPYLKQSINADAHG